MNYLIQVFNESRTPFALLGWIVFLTILVLTFGTISIVVIRQAICSNWGNKAGYTVIQQVHTGLFTVSFAELLGKKVMVHNVIETSTGCFLHMTIYVGVKTPQHHVYFLEKRCLWNFNHTIDDLYGNLTQNKPWFIYAVKTDARCEIKFPIATIEETNAIEFVKAE